MSEIEEISFSVDAGIINRLGLELVAKSETAVAELIKNAYDADANVVNLYFLNARSAGGELTIDDDGVGMTRAQLIGGFMRLATTDKIHNSISEKYFRPKAGRKGIGRFSTQRLGTNLIIQTQFDQSEAYQLEIDWNKYETDKEIQEIKNTLSVVDSEQSKTSGTTLYITNLRESWSEADIKRVYRYVADLIQPNFLSIEKSGNMVEEDRKEGFEVKFYAKNQWDDDWKVVADPQVMMLDRSLVTFSGYVDEYGIGHCRTKTKNFHVDGKLAILDEEKIITTKEETAFELLKGTKIAFKVYYFIGGDRNAYYGITRSELKVILDHLDRNGGIKLYRNGFRVPKYGDRDNDWLAIEKNGRIGKGIPFGNNRVLGLVQLTDADGRVFEESAGREGLIEQEAFNQLQEIVSSAIIEGFTNFSSWFKKTDEYKSANPDKKAAATSTAIQQITEDLKTATKIISDPEATESDRTLAVITIEQATKKILIETKAAINELEMMRILAGTGLTIAEFIHEIEQFVPALKGYIKNLVRKNLGSDVNEDLAKMDKVINSFISYTSYFDETISKNVIRDLKPINLRNAVEEFAELVEPDLKRRHIEFNTSLVGQDLITLPMHPSEWNTVLQNLYSNAKKAIARSSVSQGKIFISSHKNNALNVIYLMFYDNGVGIPKKNEDRIFDAFFTTSTPYKANGTGDINTGTGLGLYILNQIIKNRNGKMLIGEPIPEYNTCIQIQLPLASTSELEKYGY